MYTNEFFTVGGTLDPNKSDYVVRPADEQLYQAVLAREYCNVLAPRQTGKSSLMVNVVLRLQSKGVKTAIVDLTSIGSILKPNEWYQSIINILKRELELSIDEQEWWNKKSQQAVVQRFSDFLCEVVLEQIASPVVIFVDEIDSTLNLPFTDDFFAAIRALYNMRSRNPIYNRLTFVVLGVARPADLIKDRTRTPYNIGVSIDLGYFSFAEAKSLLPGLNIESVDQSETVLKRILYWTEGQPYLTQKICATIAKSKILRDIEVDQIVEQLFLSDEARKENNLIHINDRILSSLSLEKSLRIYKKILLGKHVANEERNPIISQLKLIGIIRATPKGSLVVSNKIYASFFSLAWVKSNMPFFTTARVTISAFLAIILSLLGIGLMIFFRQNSVEIQAETYRDQFVNSDSAAVKITNLSSLIQLGEDYENEAIDLFFTLGSDDQVALFSKLTMPEQISHDLDLVIKTIYIHLDNNKNHNLILESMANLLVSIREKSPDSSVLAAEIRTILKGNREFMERKYENAIESYTLASTLNPQNPTTYYYRALCYLQLNRYKDALDNFNEMVQIDNTRYSMFASLLDSNSMLNETFTNNKTDYPDLIQ